MEDILKQILSELKDIKTDIGELKTGQARLEVGQQKLKQNMIESLGTKQRTLLNMLVTNPKY